MFDRVFPYHIYTMSIYLPIYLSIYLSIYINKHITHVSVLYIFCVFFRWEEPCLRRRVFPPIGYHGATLWTRCFTYTTIYTFIYSNIYHIFITL